MKVLIVDDDQFVRQGLKRLIPWSDMGIEIVGEAWNGEIAYGMALELLPDLIITDVRMPVMDGIELSRRLRETTVDIFLIILSAYDEFNYARLALRYGVSSYIIKPLDEDKITQLIGEIRNIATVFRSNTHFRKVAYCEKQLEARLNRYLDESDDKAINTFFSRELPAMNLTGHEIKNCCLMLINTLFQYIDRVGSCREVIAQSKLEMLEHIIISKNMDEIVSFTHTVFRDILDFQLKKTAGSERIAESIREYIALHYSDPDLSVMKIADVLKISPSYASTVFRRFEGVNINRFITRMRIKKASALLMDPSKKVSDVSQMVGYTDSRYFTKVFRRHQGLTPTEHRKCIISGGAM